MKIGMRLKDLRTRKRITLKELAERTGLTTSFLSQLERNRVSPSIASLEKIATALNTKTGYFFEREEGKELVFIKKGFGKKFIEEKKGIRCDRLASGLLNIQMEPFIFTLEGGMELTKELIHSQTEKFGMVLKGKVELLYNSEKLIMEEGDSIYCAYTQKIQSITNIAKTRAKVLWVVFTGF